MPIGSSTQRRLMSMIIMRLVWRQLLMSALLLTSASVSAQDLPQPQQLAEPNVLEVFVREGCPHCADAKRYLPTLARTRPDLQIILRPVDVDVNARQDLIRYSTQAGITTPGVPTFRFHGRLLVGFTNPEHSGPELAQWLDQAAPNADRVDTAWFGEVSVDRLGLPLFTLALGLLDGFNPCAMWVLLFLLSLLVHLHDRRRMALIAGTFVLTSGVVYFAFMAAWLNVFLVIGFSNPLRIGLGLLALLIGAINVKDFLQPGLGISLSIPNTAKPGLYARMRRVMAADRLLTSLAGVVTLAVVVNFIELLCTAGFPALYTAVLTQQQLPAIEYYAYLALYIAGYITDDSLMVGIAVFALSTRKLTERAGRQLKLLSGTVMLVLGAIMLLRPDWLI
jgi:glutaredoxin